MNSRDFSIISFVKYLCSYFIFVCDILRSILWRVSGTLCFLVLLEMENLPKWKLWLHLWMCRRETDFQNDNDCNDISNVSVNLTYKRVVLKHFYSYHTISKVQIFIVFNFNFQPQDTYVSYLNFPILNGNANSKSTV